MLGKRSEIINFLIEQNKYKSYLEIGIANPDGNFNKINASNKIGVDPTIEKSFLLDPGSCLIKMTSDEFFSKRIPLPKTFDVIFIDGLHTGEQVVKDLFNAINNLSPGGTIVVHDCNPPTEWHTRPYEQYLFDKSPWNGTTYQGFVAFKEVNPELQIETVGTDWGCGIVRNPQFVYPKMPTDKEINSITWEKFFQNRKQLLSLIDPIEFEEKYTTPPEGNFLSRLFYSLFKRPSLVR